MDRARVYSLYVAKRFADRIIDISGLTVGIIGLVLAYTTGAEAVNVIVNVPSNLQPLIPSELVMKMGELLDLCLEQCFQNTNP